jgi:hypothetical protein
MKPVLYWPFFNWVNISRRERSFFLEIISMVLRLHKTIKVRKKTPPVMMMTPRVVSKSIG